MSETSGSGSSSNNPRFRNLFIAIGLVWLALFVIAQTGYPSLMDLERRVGAYVLDAVQNGHWFVQRDGFGNVAAKPPLLTWIAALVTLAVGHLTQFAVHLPSALATLGVAWLILGAGWKRFGWLAGFLGALTYLLSPMADKQVFTARYDGLFAFPVMWAALAAFHAWNTGRGWTWFWLAAAIATMVKGPLGVLLGGIGLLAAIWEWRSGTPLRLRGNHLPGIILYFAICGGWFALAYWQMGQPLIDKMIGRELIGHSLSSEEGGIGGGFYEPSINVTTYFLPWSIFGIIALWRVFKKPSADAETRRFERFLFCWFFAGLLMFSISPHQRGRLIFPLLPALALLGGRELARRLMKVQTKKIFQMAAGITVAALGFLAVYHHYLLSEAQQIKDTLAMRAMAYEVRDKVGAQFPLTYLNAPFTIQFYLNTYRLEAETNQVVKLLQGDAAAFVAVRDLAAFQETAASNSLEFYPLLSIPIKGGRTVAIVSNHPRLEWTEHMAAITGPVALRTDGVKLVQVQENEFVFERPPNKEAHVTLTNVSETPQLVRVRFTDGSFAEERRLTVGEVWRIQ